MATVADFIAESCMGDFLQRGAPDRIVGLVSWRRWSSRGALVQARRVLESRARRATSTVTVTLDAGAAGSSADLFSARSPARVWSTGTSSPRGSSSPPARFKALTHRRRREGRLDAPLVPDVAWSAAPELHAWPIGAGAAIVWRGPAGKKSGHVAVVVVLHGMRPFDGPIPTWARSFARPMRGSHGAKPLRRVRRACDSGRIRGQAATEPHPR